MRKFVSVVFLGALLAVGGIPTTPSEAVGRFAPVVSVVPGCNPTLRILNPNPGWMHVWIGNGDEAWIPPATVLQTRPVGHNLMYGKTDLRWESGIQNGIFPVYFTGGNCPPSF